VDAVPAHIARLVDAADPSQAVTMRSPGHQVRRLPLTRPHLVDSHISRAELLTVDDQPRAVLAIYRTGRLFGRSRASPGWKTWTLRAALPHYGSGRVHELRQRGGGYPSAAKAAEAVLLTLDTWPTVAEVAAELAAADQENAAAVQRRDGERAAREAAKRQAAADSEHIAEALASIRDRLAADLTNFEAAGLELALSRFPTTVKEP
jgi:hypothetical protein